MVFFSLFSSKEEEEYDEQFISWITDSMHTLGDKRLNQLALPGTHNSATYSLSRASQYAADMPDLVKYHYQKVGHQKGKFYSCHGMNGDKIKELVTTFVQYAESYPREPVILDFNHFYGMDEEQHDKLTQKIRAIVGSKLWPFEHADATLNDAQQLNIGPIVIIYHHHAGHRHSFFPGSAITAPWHNTDNIELLRERLQQSLINFDRNSKQLFVAQFIITPSVDTVLKGLWKCNHPKTLFGWAKKLNDEIVEWIAKFHQDKPLNIVLVDHYHTTNIVDLVVKLNFT